MGREHVETAREGYEHFKRGDIDWIAEQLHEKIEWRDAADVPGGQVYRGVEDVKSFLSSFDRVWEEARFEPDEFIDGDERVLVLVRFVARGRQSGIEVSRPLAHIFEWRDGKVIRTTTFFDRDAARTAFAAEDVLPPPGLRRLD